MAALTAMKRPANRARWERAAKDKAYVPLLPLIITETPAELMLKVLQSGTVSTNIYLRRLHNFCVDMNWLPWPLVPKRQWPVVRFKEKRAITADEHRQIVERERNPEREAFYRLSWHLGASQSDLAHLQAEDVDWNAGIICFVRMKTRWRGVQPPQIRFGKGVAAILAERPKTGSLFLYLQNVEPGHRATDQPHARSLDFHITPIAVGRFPFQPDRGIVQNCRELLLLAGMFAPFVAGMVIIVDADRPAFVEVTTIASGGRKQDERIGHG